MIIRKPRPLWPLLTAALIGLPVLYVASFGPACWLFNAAMDQGWPVEGSLLQRFLLALYAPVLRLEANGPEPIATALEWYASLFP